MSVEQTSRDPGAIATADVAGEPPYRGLARYEAADERWFFGREDITELIAFLAEQRSSLPLMLVGASGAGKSSLLRAGLLPRLRAAAGEVTAEITGNTGTGNAAAGGGERVVVCDLTVTGVPALAARIAAVTSGTADLPAALIVDQFEAVFTLCPDEAERSALISAACELAGRTLVVLALRADCYGRAIGYPGLLRALQERQVVLGPMTAGQVRRAVTAPAALTGPEVEEGLVEAVLADLAPAGRPDARRPDASRPDADRDEALRPDAARPDAGWDAGDRDDEPACDAGALPLLSHALLAAWRQADAGRLTVAGYRAVGGVRNALPRSADRVYDSLTLRQRRLARRLLPRLVRLTDGLPPSRTAVPRSELRGTLNELRATGAGEAGNADAVRVLAAFAGEGIITLDAGTARFTHDVVLTAWPRLRAWLEEDAAARRGHAPGGTRARPSAPARPAPARDRARTRKAQAREAARAAAAAAAREGGEGAGVAPAADSTGPGRRRTRTLGGVIALLTVLVLVAAGLAAHAFSLRQRAVTAEQAAAAAEQAANSRAVAFIAAQTLSTDPAVGAQLAAAAYALSPTPQATASLLDAAGAVPVARIADSAKSVRAVSVNTSAGGPLLVAAGSDGSLQLWNIAAAGHPVLAAALLPADSDRPLAATAFSPSGTVIAAAGTQGKVYLWQVSGTAAAPRVSALGLPLAGPGGPVSSIAFSPDGRLLAVASVDGTVRLWNVTDSARPAPDGPSLTVPGGAAVTSVAFGDGGGVLAAGTSAGTAVLWKVEGTPAPVLYPHMPLAGAGGALSGVAFSPDGNTLAAAGADGTVALWSVRAGTGSKNKGASAAADGTLTGASGAIGAIAFSPDGKSLAAAASAAGGASTAGGASGGSVLVWNLAAQQVTATVPQPQPVTSVAWDGADEIAAGDANGTVALLSLPSPVLPADGDSIAYSADGAAIAVGGTSVQLWDASKRTLLATHALAAGVSVNATAFGSDGNVAIARSDGAVALLNGHTLAPIGTPFPVTSGKNAAQSVAFSASGTLLATGGADGSVRLYDVSDPGRPHLIATGQRSGSAVSTVAFAPDGATLATAAADGAVQLWDVSAGGGSLTPAGPSLGPVQGFATGLAFSPDGKILAAGSGGGTVHLWDVAEPGHPVPLGTPLAGPSGHVPSVAFSPSGTVLAAGASDGTVWLWNMASPAHPALIAALDGPAGHVSGVAFSPSGDQVAAVSATSGVELRDTSAAAALAAVCGNLGQPVTPAQWASDVPGVPYRAGCAAG
jgi:WD40 repeat protein